MDENPQQILLCTCPNEAAGQMIAERLVRDGLAACVNIVPGLKSVFMWEGRCEIDSEVLLVIKTRRDVYEAVERAILAEVPGSRSQGEAHFARRAVGEVTDGVERFAAGAGGDDYRLTFEDFFFCAPGKEGSGGFEKLVRFEHPSHPGVVAGHIPLAGAENPIADLFKVSDVLLSRGMCPHAWIHGRGDHDRLLTGADHRGQ